MARRDLKSSTATTPPLPLLSALVWSDKAIERGEGGREEKDEEGNAGRHIAISG